MSRRVRRYLWPVLGLLVGLGALVLVLTRKKTSTTDDAKAALEDAAGAAAGAAAEGVSTAAEVVKDTAEGVGNAWDALTEWVGGWWESDPGVAFQPSADGIEYE